MSHAHSTNVHYTFERYTIPTHSHVCVIASGFGGVLDMVTDRVSTCGFLSLLSHIYPSYTLAIVLLVTLDISSHWFHVLSVTGHHKSSESLRGRIFIMRWFYEVYPFFAYCCAGTEFFYVLAYVHFHFPSQYSSVSLPAVFLIIRLTTCTYCSAAVGSLCVWPGLRIQTDHKHVSV